MANGFSAATSLLLARGWDQRFEGDLGQMWGKGAALTPVAFSLEPNTLGWRQFLENVAAVEQVGGDALAAQVAAFLQESRIRRRKQSRTELDLHLNGASIKGHEASASDFGRFVSAVSASVAALVVDQFHLQSYESRLKVVGARAGSVRAQFREPEFDDLVDGALFEQAGDTPESRAMLRLAQIVNAAQDAAEAPVDAQLDAATNLTAKATKALHELAVRMYRAGWRVDGLLLGLDEILPVSIGPSGAWRLMAATSRSAVRVRRVETAGVLDSWSWSKATMTLLVEGSRPLRVAVPPESQFRVAELNSTKDQRVAVSLQVFERELPNLQVLTKSYELLAVEPVGRLT